VPSAVVVGAGIFGAALADRLVADGWRVTLVDQFEPGDPRSESGGETRLLRYSHGPEPLYTRLAYRARSLWRELGSHVLIESGVVWFARRDGGWETESERVLRAACVPVERLDPGAVERLFPSLRVDDLEFGLLEPEAGVLRAGDGVRALVARAVSRGLRVEQGTARAEGARVVVGAPAAGGGRESLDPQAAGGGRESLDPQTAGGGGAGGRRESPVLEADHVVWACGAWLAPLFPKLVRLRVTRQDVALFDVPLEWTTPGAPGWVDFDSSFYGHGLIEPHGMKVSCDSEGADVDPSARPERAAEASIRRSREYLAHRFPALGGSVLRSAPVCHYSLTADGGFLFAQHPEHERVWLLGGGSGHGYKHGPAVAERVAAVLRGVEEPEPRFGLGERSAARALRTAGS
jgi:sarcosine oxidase